MLKRRFASNPSAYGRQDTAVQVRHLDYYFGKGDLRKQALFDINLDIPRGQIVIVMGPSGSGKTTLISLMGALRSFRHGSLNVLGQELRGLNDAQLVTVRRRIGFIFQAHNLFESLTAAQNVEMAIELRGSVPQKQARAASVLKLLGLEKRVHYKPKSLSGGQKQRVAIARALVNRPQLILADEPTAALDKESGRNVVNIFKQLAARQKSTIIMVTHDNRILDTADRIIHLVDGRLEASDPV